MKISRAARQSARRLFQSCLVDGKLDSEKMLAVIRTLAVERPRAYLATMARLKMLVEYEVNRRTFIIQSATSLPDEGKELFNTLEKKFGPPLAKSYSVNPSLIGGLRVQVGSSVWDGSVQEKLRSLNSTVQ